MTPGVILIDEIDRLYFGVARLQVARCGNIIHRAVGGGAKDILIAGFFKNTRRTAVIQHQQFFHFLRHRCHCQAIARADVADDGINIFSVV